MLGKERCNFPASSICLIFSYNPLFVPQPKYGTKVVGIQFLSYVFPLAEMAEFILFLSQLQALRLSTLLDSEHPPSLNQFFLSPPRLASSRSSTVVLAFSFHSLQDPEQPSKHYGHPSSVHVHTI